MLPGRSGRGPGVAHGSASLLCAAIVATLTACGPLVVPVPPEDSGVLAADAGGADAGSWDAGAPDAGTVDAGSFDAGPPDAGTPDAGPADAGVSGCPAGCVIPPHATARCTATSCAFDCASGWHPCGAGCAADDDATQCGGGCQTCGGVTHGQPVCRAQSCAVQCDAFFAQCGGACVPESAAQCGPSCQACPTGVGATCANGRCLWTCPPGSFQSGAGCSPGAAIAVGQRHACALTASGGVFCWGASTHGQLGAGAYDGGGLPKPVTGLSSGVLGLSLQDNSSCALLADGGVRCWGYDAQGQCGNGGAADEFVPTVLPAPPLVMLASGTNHACGLLGDGGVMCWGSNLIGQTGNGVSSSTERVPVAVLGLPPGGARALFAGDLASFAVLADGGLAGWGEDTLLPLPGLASRATALSVGAPLGSGAAHNGHACAVALDGRIWCWGRGLEGQLGRDAGAAATPAAVHGLTDARSTCAGTYSTCALFADAGVSCWGGNASGQLGNGNFSGGPVPQPVSGVGRVTSLGCSAFTTCVVSDLGVFCWGDNTGGQLGAPSPSTSPSPVPVVPP